MKYEKPKKSIKIWKCLFGFPGIFILHGLSFKARLWKVKMKFEFQFSNSIRNGFKWNSSSRGFQLFQIWTSRQFSTSKLHFKPLESVFQRFQPNQVWFWPLIKEETEEILWNLSGRNHSVLCNFVHLSVSLRKVHQLMHVTLFQLRPKVIKCNLNVIILFDVCFIFVSVPFAALLPVKTVLTCRLHKPSTISDRNFQ